MAKKISKAGDRGEDGTLRCPKCGGTSFKAKRGAAKYAVGVLAPKGKVKCETCSATFKRG